MHSAYRTGATLALCLGASQAALLTLTPILASVAADFDVSTATAGQLRTVSGITAGTCALLSGLLAARVGLRELLGVGLGLLALGSLGTAAAPSLGAAAVAQIPLGLGVGLSYSAAVAATAEWSEPEQRSRVLSVALLGPPLAWIVCMPVAGVVGDINWRAAWLVAPFVLAVVAVAALFRQTSSPPATVRAGLGAVLREPGVLRWSIGELLAYSAWLGVLIFIGALCVEVHGLSVAATGLMLGLATIFYVPGNFLFRRWVDHRPRLLLIGLALASAGVTAVLGAVRPNAWVSVALFGGLAFLAGGRTLAGSARGLGLAPELRLGVTGVRTAALQYGSFLGAAVGGMALAVGGFTAVGAAFAGLFAAAAIPHLRADA